MTGIIGGALSQVSLALQEAQNAAVVVRCGTVFFAEDSSVNITVQLDNDPSGTPVSAVSTVGVLEAGERVIMLAYPPRGLVIIGRLDNNGSYDELRLTSTAQATLTSTDHALQIGPTDGVNLIADGDEIQARNNGAASTLVLNGDGGIVNIPTPGGSGLNVGPVTGAHTVLGFNQLWSMNNVTGADLFLNFSAGSTGNVVIGNNTAAGAQLVAVAMTPTVFTNAAAGGAISSTSFVSSNALGSTFTVPRSGRFMVHFGARANMTATADQRGLWTFQIQITNSAGAVVRGGSDLEACEAPVLNAASANAGRFNGGKSVYVATTGLGGFVPGATIFIVMVARVTAVTATIQLDNAYITLQPLP